MFSDPAKNVEQFDLSHGHSVADLGSGAGFYAEALGRAVGSTGKVFAVDVQKDLLKKIKTAADHAKLENIEVIWGDVERLGGTKLNDISVDRVVAANLLFQLEDRKSFVAEVKRILKSGGKAIIIDWKDSFGGMGPAPEAVISVEGVTGLFVEEGFIFEREINVGEHHFGLIFRKP